MNVLRDVVLLFGVTLSFLTAIGCLISLALA